MSTGEAAPSSGKHADPHYYRNFVGFFILGTFNNFAYVAVNSASKSLAKALDAQQYIGAILWCLVGFGAALQLVHAFLLENTPTSIRMTVTTCLFILGLVGVAMCEHVNFWFLLASVVLVGMGTSFGQCVVLGYLKLFEPETVGGWSSGTGVAGMAGSLTMILFAFLNLSVETKFLVLLPTIGIYALMYFVVIKPPRPDDTEKSNADTTSKDVEKAPLLSPVRTEIGTTSLDTSGIDDVYSSTEPADSHAGIPTYVSASEAVIAVAPPGETGLQRTLRCLRIVLWRAINLAVVYFAEYVVSVGCAALTGPKGGYTNPNFFQSHIFVVLAFCYQLGVFISRSSLRFFKIHQIEWLSVLQLANMVFWLCNCVYQWMPYYVAFIAMVYVGLLGGSSYVNTFYLLLNDKTIPEEDRAFVVYLAAIFTNIGISLAAAFTLIMDATFLKHQVEGRSG